MAELEQNFLPTGKIAHSFSDLLAKELALEWCDMQEASEQLAPEVRMVTTTEVEDNDSSVSRS